MTAPISCRCGEYVCKDFQCHTLRDAGMLCSRRELLQAAQNRPTWVVHEPPLNDAWGVHHSKLFLAEFERGVRLIVHTSNLIHQVRWGMLSHSVLSRVL